MKLAVIGRPCRVRSDRDDREGFTIVEVVVAMGIFLLGMSSLLGLLAFGATVTRHAALAGEASAAVEAVVADLEERFFPLDAEGNAGEPVEIVDRPLPQNPAIVYTAKPTPNPEQLDWPGGPLEYRVDVAVAWKSGGQRRTKTFTTLLLREVPFGERLRRQFVETRE